jgi:prepilin-type N-terminal cleavage/methylation domain-containing protein
MTSLSFLSRRKGGFTLVELLVSMAILSLMLVTVASAISYVTGLFTSNLGAYDNFSKARVMLSVFDRDIQMMVMRRDLAAFVDNTGKPACAFYTNIEGYNPTSEARAISLVNYKLQTTATSSVLNRLSYGMNYTATSASVGTTGTLTQLGTLSLQTDSLATGVVAFQWQFVDGNGTVQTPTSSANAFLYNYQAPGLATNYRTVVVSMVVLSSSAYTIATQSGTLSKLTDSTSIFPTTAPANLTYSQVWNSILAGTPVSPANAANVTALLAEPAPVRAGIEVIQRYIPLPITTPSS